MFIFLVFSVFFVRIISIVENSRDGGEDNVFLFLYILNLLLVFFECSCGSLGIVLILGVWRWELRGFVYMEVNYSVVKEIKYIF